MENRSVSWQRTRSINSRTKYWDYVHRHQRKNETGEAEEFLAANMDRVAAQEPSDIDKEVQLRVQKLLTIAKQILTEQQFKVFFFVTERALTERATAKVLGVTHQRVHAIWMTARKKLQVAYEQRTA